MMGKQKEVEEWLMGSGESAETEASMKNKNNMPLFKIIDGINTKEDHNDTEKPHEDHDSWMFSTFERQQTKPPSREKTMMI